MCITAINITSFEKICLVYQFLFKRSQIQYRLRKKLIAFTSGINEKNLRILKLRIVIIVLYK